MKTNIESGDNVLAEPIRLETRNVIDDLRRRCPLPVLMKRMGLGKHVKPSCCSPLRPDENPSWGVYPRGDRWFWKDHGNSDGGDEIAFLSRVKKLDSGMGFRQILAYWEDVANTQAAGSEPVELIVPEPRSKPDRSGFGPGIEDQIDRLSNLRNIDRRGLLVAREIGVLVFGQFVGHEVYGITDASGNILELRRLDGNLFPAHGDIVERKSHAVKGSRKNWPVGIANVGDRPMILLVEGLPDLLAAFEVLVTEGARDRVATAAMLSAGSRLGTDALALFKDRHVRIVPHSDQPGRTAATCWQRQLLEAGAAKVDFFCVTEKAEDDGSPVKDLNDYLPIYRMETTAGLAEGRIL